MRTVWTIFFLLLLKMSNIDTGTFRMQSNGIWRACYAECVSQKRCDKKFA